MPAHKRTDKGALNPNAKLTDDAVRAIRRLRLEYALTYQVLGERFGVNLWHIRDICLGKARPDVK